MPTQAEIDRLCREAVKGQIKRIGESTRHVKVPQSHELMQPAEGRHYHFYPEVFLQLAGASEFSFPGEKINTGPGEICIVPIGLPHKERAFHRKDKFSQIVFMLSSNSLEWHMKEKGGDGQSVSIHDTQILKTAKALSLTRYLMDICDIFHRQSESRSAILAGLLLAYFGSINDLLACRQTEAGESYRIMRCHHEIQRRLADPDLSVKHLASYLRCSPNYLSYLFRRETGMSLVGYILQERLYQAKNLLENSPLMTIKEIAFAVGIQDPCYFSRVFMRGTGMTPKNYRESSLADRTPLIGRYLYSK